MRHDLVEVRVDRLAKKHDVFACVRSSVEEKLTNGSNATNCIF